MLAYILRRLALIVPTLFGIMLINFALVQFVPGGPVEQILAQLESEADVFSGIAGGGGKARRAGRAVTTRAGTQLAEHGARLHRGELVRVAEQDQPRAGGPADLQQPDRLPVAELAGLIDDEDMAVIEFGAARGEQAGHCARFDTGLLA